MEEERELGSTADNNASDSEKQDIPIKVGCWRLQECVLIILLSFCEFIKGWIVFRKWRKNKKNEIVCPFMLEHISEGEPSYLNRKAEFPEYFLDTSICTSTWVQNVNTVAIPEWCYELWNVFHDVDPVWV